MASTSKNGRGQTGGGQTGAGQTGAGKTGVLHAGSAALRKVFGNPLSRQKPAADHQATKCDPFTDVSISAIIEGEIVPRLMLAHRGPAIDRRDAEIPPTEASRFADLPLQLDAARLLEEVDRFLAEGVSVEAIYIDLLAPAARRLGEMWETDECDFTDVTMGLWRLQEVMRDIAERSPPAALEPSSGRSVLTATMPGDQHCFGAMMLDEVFARAGWQSMAIPRPMRRELLDAVAKRHFDVVCLTITRNCPTTSISSLIAAIRSGSANSHVAVLIGGNAINQNPSIVEEVGADGTGADARAAVEIAEKIVITASDRLPAQT
ncbi:MAG: cobalamin-dependent protein [Pseudomonadota bacterium]